MLAALALWFGGCSGESSSTRVPPTPVTVLSTPTSVPGPTPLPVGDCFDRGPGDYVDTIERPEGSRSFRIHAPPSYDGRTAVPLLFNFHGQSRTALEQETYSGLVPVADANGFILVSPEGGQRMWNVIGLYGEGGIDDLGSVAAIVEHVQAEFCIDASRVFATGLSNGAEMASQVGCLLPGLFAGIAPVAGIVYQGCEGPPLAVIAFHGTEDFNVPYETAPEAVREWARYNGCPADPGKERAGEQVVREVYFGCEGAPVVFYTLEGGGHTWPGAEHESGGVGPTNHEISASELLWQFFRNVKR